MSVKKHQSYLELYREKLHAELDQMQYGAPHHERSAGGASNSAATTGLWIAASMTALIAGFTLLQLF